MSKKQKEIKLARRVAEKRKKLAIEDKNMTQRLMENIRKRCDQMNADLDTSADARIAQLKKDQAGFVSGIVEKLDEKLQADELGKKEMTNIWNEQVYSRIEKQIRNKVNDIDSKKLTERLCSESTEYVAAMKEKLIFLDVVIPSEYDPFESKKHIIKIDARKRDNKCYDGIIDPLNEQIEKVMEIHEGREHLLKGGGLQGDLPVNMWNKIYSTPHGYAAKWFADDAKPKDPVMVARKQKRGKSDGVALPMDHYNIPTGAEGARISRLEQPAGKKCDKKDPKEWKPPFALDSEKVKNVDWKDPYATS